MKENLDLRKIKKIIIGSSVAKDEAYRLVTEDLRDVLKNHYGTSPKIVTDSESSDFANVISIGGPTINSLNKQLIDKRLITLPSQMAEESYIINSFDPSNGQSISIIGSDARGDIYGAYWLIDKIRSEKVPSKLNIYRSPAFKLRTVWATAPMYDHDEVAIGWNDLWWKVQFERTWQAQPLHTMPYLVPQVFVNEERFRKAVERFKKFCKIILSLGYNVLTLGDVLHLITLDKSDTIKKDRVLYLRHKIYQKYFAQMINYAAKLHLDFYIMNDEFTYLTPVQKEIGEICPINSKLWDFHKEKYREVFENFPEIKGVQIRVGEILAIGSEAHQDYLGNKIVYHTCPKCSHLSYVDKWKILIKQTYEVCKEFNKKLIVRTWTIGEKELHSNPELYEEVFNDLPSENLLTSMKHTMTDYWFHQPRNPTIGVGNKAQIIEMSCVREFDGRCYFPCYMGKTFKEDLEFALSKNGTGVWIWAQEGFTPPLRNPSKYYNITYFKGFTHWVQANLYTMARLLWDPNEDYYDIAQDWGTIEYGKEASKDIADILIKSPEAIKLGLYVLGYVKNHLWQPQFPWSLRWFIIFARDGLEDMYKDCKNELEKNIQDGVNASKICDEMVKLMEKTKQKIKNKGLYEQTYESLIHEKAFMDTLRYFRESFLRYFHLKENKGKLRENEHIKLKDALTNLKIAIKNYDKNHSLYDLTEIEEFVRRTEREII